jgi:hypothetical protein
MLNFYFSFFFLLALQKEKEADDVLHGLLKKVILHKNREEFVRLFLDNNFSMEGFNDPVKLNALYEGIEFWKNIDKKEVFVFCLCFSSVKLFNIYQC